MALGEQRDPETLRERLTAWLRARRPAATAVELSLPVAPKIGFSNETFLVDAHVREGGRDLTEPLVVRLEPTSSASSPSTTSRGRPASSARSPAAKCPWRRSAGSRRTPASSGAPST